MSPVFSVLVALLVPFLGAFACALVPRAVGARAGGVAALTTVASASLLAWAAWASEGVVVSQMPWAPSVGLSLGLLLDRLSLFFALVVAGMGVAVTAYAMRYLHDDPEEHPRFFSSLLLFMGAMLGVCLSADLLSLFVFWELTGLASFLLIGFSYDTMAGMRGARMALLTTAGTGLALMLGVVLLGEAYGTYELDAILEGTPRNPALASLSIPFLLAGAFGKSAQFPLQYWLPNAMAAPTPVSAYLHSATMVKLGVFLVARLSPAFAGNEAWEGSIASLCFLTCALGALLSFLSHDLKAILAYSTVSQLGALMGFFALGPSSYQGADLLHVLAHVLYKGGLFMLAGIVDHACGTRDLRALGGLGRRSPALAVIGLLLCLSLASLPGTLAFVSKELVLADLLALRAGVGAKGALLLGAFLFAAILKVAIAVRLFVHLFVRAAPAPKGGAPAEEFHAPGVSLLAAPGVLALASVLLGIAPGVLTPMLARAGAGISDPRVPELHAWHGISEPFLYSLAVTLGGLALYAATSALGWGRLAIPRMLEFDRAFDASHAGLLRVAEASVSVFRGDAARDHLPIVLATVAAAGVVLIAREPGLVSLEALAAFGSPFSWSGAVVTRVVTCAVMAFAGVVVLFARQVLTRLVATSLIGLLVTVLYVLFRAPDLALTQILVETLVLIATVILLVRLRAVEFLRKDESRGTRRLVHALVACGVGTLMTGLVLVAGSRAPSDADRIGTAFLAKALPEAAGANVVNVILVDFRGTDTLFEITVLVIATLGCLGLVVARGGGTRRV